MPTQQPKCKKLLFIISGLILFSGTVWKGLMLLDTGKLSGAEFVSLISAFAVISLLIAFSDQVQEFSIAGNFVKLKEVKRDVELAISELQSARNSNFKALLKLSMIRDGGFFGSTGPKEASVSKFWDIFQAIKQANAYDDLVEDIFSTLEIVLRLQRYKIMDSCTLQRDRENDISPDDLLINRLEASVIDDQLLRTTPTPDKDEIITQLKEAIGEYRKLYDLREQLRVSFKK